MERLKLPETVALQCSFKFKVSVEKILKLLVLAFSPTLSNTLVPEADVVLGKKYLRFPVSSA